MQSPDEKIMEAGGETARFAKSNRRNAKALSLEAGGGIEPPHGGFADLGITTLLPGPS